MGAGLNKKAKERLSAAKREGGTELNFSECSIQDFKNFGPVVAMNKLVILNLAKNYIAELPPTMEKLKQLTDLDLSNNQIPRLCPQIVVMTNLKRFILSDNQLAELQPMSSFRQLTYLDVSNNRILTLPNDIVAAPIQHLKYGGNGLGTAPVVIWEFGSKLRSLWLNNNALGARLPDAITRLNQLELLDLSICSFSAFPTMICSITTLKKLYIRGNAFEQIPPEFTRLQALEVLDLSENGITNLDKITFRKCPNLQELYLGTNRLKAICPGLGACKKLRVIDCQKNYLTKIPRELGWLDASMRKMNFSFNPIQTCPGELCFLTPSLELKLEQCAELKYPFREWYMKGTPYLLDNLKPYCSAYPLSSIASGPELNVTFCGNPTSFTIQSKDKTGDNRQSGGDNFTAEVVNPADGTVIEQVVINDQKNGTYKCFYNCKMAGKFELHVSTDGEPIKGSPYPLSVAPGPTFAQNCTVTGDGLKKGIVGISNTFLITSFDRFGNKRNGGGDAYTVTIEGGSKPRAVIEDKKDGTYVVTFTPNWAADYEINVKLGNLLLAGCPFFCDCK